MLYPTQQHILPEHADKAGLVEEPSFQDTYKISSSFGNKEEFHIPSHPWSPGRGDPEPCATPLLSLLTGKPAASRLLLPGVAALVPGQMCTSGGDRQGGGWGTPVTRKGLAPRVLSVLCAHPSPTCPTDGQDHTMTWNDRAWCKDWKRHQG